MFKFTVIAVILFIATAINVIAAVISWHRAKTRHSLYFAIGITGVTFWTLISGLDYAAVPISLKVFFAKWEYAAYHVALVFFLMFILLYTGYEELLEKKWLRASLWVIPIVNVLLAWTNDWHGWVWRGFVRSEFGDNTVIFEHGPGFLWIAGTGYLLIVSIILGAWLASRRGSIFSRRQGRLLFFASLLPLVGNLFYQFQPLEFDGVDWSSILFSISSVLFVWALYGTRLLDLVPIAREKLIDSLSDGMIVLDMRNRIVDVNLPAARMVGSLPEKLLGRNMDAFIPLAQVLLGQPSERETRTELEIEGAERRYYDILVSPLFEGKTSVIGRLVIFRDITERKRTQDELQKFAITDSLTGLFNRRHFFDLGEKEFAKSTRYDRSLSVILLDIDFFKGINDTYGHFVGDRVLAQVGVLLHKSGREVDLTARYGGEEFIILLPETDCESAKLVAERLRKLIEESLIQIENNLIRFTASFGVAAKDGANAETFDQLVSQADQALYEAKRVGRNQVVCYHGE